MSIISQHLRDLVAKQIKEHGIVVWFDPEEQFTAFVSDLDLPGIKMVRYEGSFYALRYVLEPFINATEPPRLLVYIPQGQEQTHHALAEVIAAGVVIQPGQQPPTRNTRLSVLARNALKPVIGEQSALAIEKQVEAQGLTLVDLDKIAEKGVGVASGVIALILGSSTPLEVALVFLSDSGRDEELKTKNALPELADLLSSAFAVTVRPEETLPTVRQRLARHVLVTDLIHQLSGNTPPSLQSVTAAKTEGAIEACVALVRKWRNDRIRKDSYVEHSLQVEQDLKLDEMEVELGQAAVIESFLALEKKLLKKIETTLLLDPEDEFVNLARIRQSSFWSDHSPDLQAHWALVATAGQVLLEARRIEKAMKTLAPGLIPIFAAYTGGDNPWCLLDTYHRHMERRWHDFDFEIGDRHDGLEKLVHKARQRYMEVGGKLSEAFVARAQLEGFIPPALQRQTATFSGCVKPQLAQGKTAYVLVDALRYEMARELMAILSHDGEISIEARTGAVPTITPIGMAALMPGAEQSLIVRPAGKGELAAEVKGVLLKDRKERVAFFKQAAGVSVFEGKLEDLLPKPKRKTEEGIRGADLILITSQEIDALCEGDNISLARRVMDEILHDLRRACRILSDFGVRTIVFAADHGFLFGDEIGSDMKIDPPGGETADLHRRVWIGNGGASAKSYIRAKLSAFNIGGDLELAVPINFDCFKSAGGARAYFHGGLSPQEWIIPVVTVRSHRKAPAAAVKDIEWKLLPGSKKISTRFISIQILGHSPSLLKVTAPKVRVEIRKKSESLSTPVSSSYGFEEATGDIQLRFVESSPGTLEPNTVTLMIRSGFGEKLVSVHLLDADSGVELAKIPEIEMSISQ